MQQYYYQIGAKVLGPHTIDQLVTLKTRGIINNDTQVCLAGEEKWQYASAILPASALIKNNGRTHLIAPQTSSGKETSSPSLDELPVTRKQGYLVIGILALMALLLAISTFRTPSAPKEPQYEYAVRQISREDMQYQAKETVDIYYKTYPLYNSPFAAGENKGAWEYVGPLCNDGINASWILFRRRISN